MCHDTIQWKDDHDCCRVIDHCPCGYILHYRMFIKMTLPGVDNGVDHGVDYGLDHGVDQVNQPKKQNGRVRRKNQKKISKEN